MNKENFTKHEKNLRRCISCYAQKNKKNLFRIVRKPDSSIIYDAEGKENGRGAYVCRETECIERAFKSKKLDRALKSVVPSELKMVLTEMIDQSEIKSE